MGCHLYFKRNQGKLNLICLHKVFLIILNIAGFTVVATIILQESKIMLAVFSQLEIQLSPDIIANVLSVPSPNKLIQLLSIFLFSRFQIHSPYCMHCRHAV